MKKIISILLISLLSSCTNVEYGIVKDVKSVDNTTCLYTIHRFDIVTINQTDFKFDSCGKFKIGDTIFDNKKH